MPDDSTADVLTFGALVAGGGLAGYLGSRWLAGRRLPASSATVAPPLHTAFASRLPASALPPPDEVGPETTPDPSPREVNAAASQRGSLPRTFDPMFDRFRGDIPIEYLRALAMRESGMKPTTKGRAAWGLLQVTETVRRDYNKAHRTAYARDRLLEPEINVAIGAWLLRIIINSYQRNQDEVPNLRADWGNLRFVELVTYGWNAGWTTAKGGGVGRVVEWLKAKGARDIDIDLVHAHARDAGASVHLRNPAKVSWCKGVAALYQRERSFNAAPVTTPTA